MTFIIPSSSLLFSTFPAFLSLGSTRRLGYESLKKKDKNNILFESSEEGETDRCYSTTVSHSVSPPIRYPFSDDSIRFFFCQLLFKPTFSDVGAFSVPCCHLCPSPLRDPSCCFPASTCQHASGSQCLHPRGVCTINFTFFFRPQLPLRKKPISSCL